MSLAISQSQIVRKGRNQPDVREASERGTSKKYTLHYFTENGKAVRRD
jgi:hypothetical protein